MIINYPKTKHGIEELECKVASVHIEAVKSYIKQLPCPKDQKVALLKAVKEDLENGR